MGIRPSCSICRREFDVQFSYQMEERRTRDAEGGERVLFVYFCSQACLDRSHAGGDGRVECDGCGASFPLELASQVLFVSGRRRYACNSDCRSRVLAEARWAERGQIARRLDAGRPRVLAVFNHKGGTGKTTTAVSVAAGLAARGQRVLLYHVLVMGLPLAAAVRTARPGLDVLPANETLAAAELYLAGCKRRDRVLAERLAVARELYDFVLVDCSPSLSLLNQNALVFADSVLCPVACDYLSLVGVRQVLRTIKHVNKLLGHPVRLWGVLPTLYDARANICREALDTLRDHFGATCLEPIRLAIKVKEAPAQGQTLQEYAPESSAARDYAEVVSRLLREDSSAIVAPTASLVGEVG
jgi:chromosome partitioning protein